MLPPRGAARPYLSTTSDLYISSNCGGPIPACTELGALSSPSQKEGSGAGYVRRATNDTQENKHAPHRIPCQSHCSPNPSARREAASSAKLTYRGLFIRVPAYSAASARRRTAHQEGMSRPSAPQSDHKWSLTRFVDADAFTRMCLCQNSSLRRVGLKVRRARSTRCMQVASTLCN